MKYKILISILLLLSITAYDRNKAMDYAIKYAKKANHDCARIVGRVVHMAISEVNYVNIKKTKMHLVIVQIL